VSLDLELDAWRREWSADTEPLPELKRRVFAQNRRLGLGIAAIAVCLAIGTGIAVGHPFGSWWGGFAVGLWVASAVGVGYVLWVRRGTWRPASETTEAYLVLLHERAIAEQRKLKFLSRAALVTLVAYGAFLLATRNVTWSRALVAIGLLVETRWIQWLERRRRDRVEAAAALRTQWSEGPKGQSPERMEQP